MNEKICSYCKKLKNINDFITNVKETKTCINCKEYKHKYILKMKSTVKNDNILKKHILDIKDNTEECEDCGEYFIKKLRYQLVNIYNASDNLPSWDKAINLYFGRIRSIKKRDILLKNGTFIKICNECRNDRILIHRIELKDQRSKK